MSSASVPAQLGRYRILSKLGQGGMGVVYLAEDTLLSRRVAVKVPHFSEADGPTIIERFHREARTAAAIDHPNICPVHDIAEVDGTHFLVMPYIEGTPLSRLIDTDNPWPPMRAAALVRQLALAVDVLHQRGLIHRDLKSSNVLLRPNGEPVLMDFGLARSFTEQTRLLTQTGTVLGTPPYMAPEQILGKAEAIGPATDVYSLGVIFYELLTRSLPFEGPPAAVYGQILHADPEPPSARRPGLDTDLDRVCLRALAKRPAERFASMAAFAETLIPWACPVAVVADPLLVSPPTVVDLEPITLLPPLADPDLIPPAHVADPPLLPPPLADPPLIAPPTVADPPLIPPPTVADPPLLAPPPPLVAEPAPVAPLPPRVAEEPCLTCPGCGAALKVPPTLTGKQLKCPRCQTILTAAVATSPRSPPKRTNVDTAAPRLLETVTASPPRPPSPLREFGGRTIRILCLTVVALLTAGLMAWMMLTQDLALALLTDLVAVSLIAWLLRRKGNPSAPNSSGKVIEKKAPVARERERDRPPQNGFDNTLGMKLVLIPAGKFLMGSPKEEKERRENESQHEVEISRPFYLGATAVTQEQYEKVIGTNPSWFSHMGSGKDKVQGMDTRRFPVESVCWDEAEEFCRKLSGMPGEKEAGRRYRLPTEGEWEYACRGGADSSTPFHYGSSLSATQANIDGTHAYGGAAKGPNLGRTSAVGSYQPNAFGLFDMHGNVEEWCADWFGRYPPDLGPVKDPSGPTTGSRRVLRGGSWFFYGRLCRSANRGNEAPGSRGNYIGFRVVCVSGGVQS